MACALASLVGRGHEPHTVRGNLDHKADAACRPVISEELVLDRGFEVGTLVYRAPEILPGDLAYGRPADIWSMGLMFAEATGSEFHKWTQSTRTWSVVGYMLAFFAQLGTPSSPASRGLPLWPMQAPQVRGQVWPDSVRASLGPSGVELLSVVLAWDPAGRPDAQAVCGHGFVQPQRMVLGGHLLEDASLETPKVWHGQRHDWNILTSWLLRSFSSCRPTRR